MVLKNQLGQVLDALGYGAFGATDVFAGEGHARGDRPRTARASRASSPTATRTTTSADFGVLDTPTPGSGPLAAPEPGLAVLLALAVFAFSAARRTRSPSTV